MGEVDDGKYMVGDKIYTTNVNSYFKNAAGN